MTRRAQLVVLAVLLLLLVLGVWFPAHTQGDQPVSFLHDAGMQMTIPQSEFVPVEAVRSAGPVPGALPAPNASPATGNWPVPSASLRSATPAARATARPRPASREASRTGTIAGVASWWASFGAGIYAALPGYVAGTRVTVRVWSGQLHVDAPVITSCQCYVGTPQERIVDVSPGILHALGLDPGRGLYPVAIERLP